MIPFILNSKSDTNYSIRIQNSYLCGADQGVTGGGQEDWGDATDSYLEWGVDYTSVNGYQSSFKQIFTSIFFKDQL